MAKELQIGKRMKISEAQRNMFGAVVGASIALGMSLVLSVYFLKMIRFNAKVIAEKDDAIEGYSEAIRVIGVCKEPRGKVYSDNELSSTSCTPNDIVVKDVPNSLRSKVMVEMAQNEDLDSVGRSGLSVCKNADGKKYSHEYLLRKFENATTDEDRKENFRIFTMCSALRTVPDALPASENDVALIASLNKIFQMSYWEPESLAPDDTETLGIGSLGAIGVGITVETDVPTVIQILQNMERSIRDISIQNASIEWKDGRLELDAKALAYYTKRAGLTEGIETITGKGEITKTLNDETDSEGESE